MIPLNDGAARNRRLALLIAASSYSITLLYLLYGGTSQGKQWFRSLIPNDDSNGAAILLIVFTAPIFVASVAAILLLKADGGSATDANIIRTQQHSTCRNHIRQAVKRILASQRLFTVTFVIVPCLIFFVCVVQRHYTTALETYPDRDMNYTNQTNAMEENEEYNKEITSWKWDLLHHISNACAITGLVAFANLLIPVSKSSPLVELVGWTPQEALLMHKYAGRLAIIGITLHGFGHLIHAYWRWWTLFVGGSIDELSSTQSRHWMEKSFWRGLMPPRECWEQQFSSHQSTHLDFGQGCINDNVSCSCEDFWINFTGSIGLIALLALACGSVNYIRRHHYRVFYVVHITTGPLFILAAMLHYKRTILYICPSLLYYASTSVPVYVDSWLSRRRYSNGSKVISVSKIPCPSHQRPNGNVLSIEFEASIDTMAKFQPEPGSYCTLQVPSLSLVAHPFTVNIVPGQANRMRMLIRQVGPFTTQLVDLLESSPTRQHKTSSFTEEKKECCDIESQSSFISLPKMHINLYGTSSLRSKQIYHHDSALIIAAGIGITPYLSLLMKIAASSETNSSLKSVTFHWVCRDAGLIRFVHEHYFAAIQDKFNGGGGSASVRIITHYTGSDDEANLFNYGLEAVHYQIDRQDGAPVQSRFYSVSNNRTLITFVSIFGVGVVEVLRAGCIVGFLAIFIISIVLSVVSYMVFNNDHHTQKANRKPLSTDESYGSCLQQAQENTCLNNSFSYEFHAKGRPSEATLLSSLQDSENPGLFLCGPSSMMKQLLSFLSTSNHKDAAVYEEIFEV